ncbi:MAG: ABC transporter ATP-binding protein [Phycisphaerales bacterium]|nr:MAG: ABC transporter ATP-binding protein [Phycisphaerales bacterium]
MTVPALALQDLSKRFGRICAVDRLSLEVRPGHMAGFLGPNGAGKSTTLYMIPRLVRPSGGRIRVFGADIWRDFKQAIRSVGIMVEAPAFYNYLSGRKNLELAARVLGTVPRQDIDEILERIGLADRCSDKVRTYSMGMKQRLGIGRAMLGRPRLLVLDEPTNGMDPEGTREILSFLRERVRTDGLSVFISSHLLYEVEEYCDTVFVIDRGRLIASGQVKDILTPHERIVRVTFEGQVPGRRALMAQDRIIEVKTLTATSLEVTLARDEPAWLNQHLLRAGFNVAAISPRQKTLKEFFLSITGDSDNA